MTLKLTRVDGITLKKPFEIYDENHIRMVLSKSYFLEGILDYHSFFIRLSYDYSKLSIGLTQDFSKTYTYRYEYHNNMKNPTIIVGEWDDVIYTAQYLRNSMFMHKKLSSKTNTCVYSLV